MVATTTCVGHRCDECSVCTAGTCCGDAVVDASLPEEGALGLAKGQQIGSLAVAENGRVLCHLCGLAFNDLAAHARMKHGVTADEYRAAFGLASGTALCSQVVSERRRTNPGPGFAGVHPSELLTPEQRSRIASRREQRTEVKMKRRARMLSGQAKAMAEKSAEAMQDPARSGKARRKKIEARRRHKDYTQTCPECGWTFCRVGNRPRVTCGQPECVQRSKLRANAKRWSQ